MKIQFSFVFLLTINLLLIPAKYCYAQSSVIAPAKKEKPLNPMIMKTAEKQHSPRFTNAYSVVNGLNMYYEIYGEGKPLVLIHGGGSTIHTTFGRVLEIFARSHKVIAVELQAHGHTHDIDRPLSFEQDADDVAALLRNLNIAKADFFGFSNGGTTAFQIAIRHPHLVDKLIAASAIFKREGAQQFLWDLIKKGKLEDMPQQLKDAYLAINPVKEDLIKMHDRDQVRMLNFKDIPDQAIASIKARTLILCGDNDVTTHAHAAEMCRLIAHSRLMIIPGIHGEYIGEITTLQPNNKSYEQVAMLIAAFLNSN